MSALVLMPSIGIHEERRVSSWWVPTCARFISRMLFANLLLSWGAKAGWGCREGKLSCALGEAELT